MSIVTSSPALPTRSTTLPSSSSVLTTVTSLPSFSIMPASVAAGSSLKSPIPSAILFATARPIITIMLTSTMKRPPTISATLARADPRPDRL